MDFSDTLYHLSEAEDPDVINTLQQQLEDYVQRTPQLVHVRRGDEQTTWLHTAVDYRLDKVVALLIRHGADPNAQSAEGAVPLFHVYDERGTSDAAVRTATALLAGGANPNAVLASGVSLLYRACVEGYDGVADQLRRHGATLDLKTATVLGLDDEVARLLAEAPDPGKLIRETPGLGGDAVAAASFAWNVDGKPIETLCLLLRHGLDANQKGQFNWPLVVGAARTGYALDQLRALITAGADVNATIQHGGEYRTALDMVLDDGHHDRDRATIEVLRFAGGKTYSELHPKPRKRRRNE